MRKLPILIITAITLCGVTISPVTAAELVVEDHKTAQVDSSIAQEDTSFSTPKRIVVVPIFPPTSDFGVQERDWFRGIYYFLTANKNRPGFTDIPFHFVVTGEGRVFKGNSGGEERKISIQDVGDDAVVIGYLAENIGTTFDPRAEEQLGNLILTVANRNAIPLDQVSITGVQYVRDSQQQSVRLEKQAVFGLWRTGINRVVNSIRGQYRPRPKTYSASVVKIELADTKVAAGQTAKGKITIKNVGKYGIYGGTASELVATSSGSSSRFFLQGTWLSRSQFSVMGEGAVLLPGSELEFNFEVLAPLFLGRQTEEFTLRTIDGAAVAESKFSLTLDVQRPETPIVVIGNTETGWLRVRQTPGTASPEITRVSTGERFLQTDTTSNGWLQIKLVDGRSGWISRQYVRYL